MRGLPHAIVVCGCFLGACGSSGAFDADFEGIPVVVELLDDEFVRFEGDRRPVEYFLLQMRYRCRAADGAAERLPNVRVAVAEGAAVSPEFLSWLSNELGRAGVRRVSFGAGE